MSYDELVVAIQECEREMFHREFSNDSLDKITKLVAQGKSQDLACDIIISEKFNLAISLLETKVNLSNSNVCCDSDDDFAPAEFLFRKPAKK